VVRRKHDAISSEVAADAHFATRSEEVDGEPAVVAEAAIEAATEPTSLAAIEPALVSQQAPEQISEEFFCCCFSTDFVARMAASAEAKDEETVGGVAAAKRDITAVAQSKSVRIALETVGPHDERGRRTGDQPYAHAGPSCGIGTPCRRAQLSKGRMADKVTEFQENTNLAA